MAEPPSLAGAVHERSIRVVPPGVAERLVGAPGATVSVVELATLEGSPAPTELMAETR